MKDTIRGYLSINSEGYFWDTYKDKCGGEHRVLIAAPGGVVVRRPIPSSLYIKFAALKLDEESIRTFANKYGKLGVFSHCYEGNPGRELSMPVDTISEGYADWCKTIRELRCAFELWKVFSNPTTDRMSLLRKMVDVRGNTVVFTNRNTSAKDVGLYEVTDRPRYCGSEIARIIRENRFHAAGWMLMSMLNQATKTVWLHPVLYTFTSDGAFKLIDEPDSLEGWLWWQLTNCVLKAKSPQRIKCTHCEKEIINARHRDRLYCSARCTKAAQRQRKNAEALKSASADTLSSLGSLAELWMLSKEMCK